MSARCPKTGQAHNWKKFGEAESKSDQLDDEPDRIVFYACEDCSETYSVTLFGPKRKKK